MLLYYHSLMFYNHFYRGIVTADVLAKGLSRGAIATRKQERVDKGHGVYTGSAPSMKVKAYV